MKLRFYQWVVPMALLMALLGLLQAQPTILQQPSSQLDVPLGTNVVLCVAAQSSATTNLLYHWHRNGVLIPGATNSCLVINDIQATNCGSFRVRVGDGDGVVVSHVADVTVGIKAFAGEDTVSNALDLSQLRSPIRSYNSNALKQAGTPLIISGDPGGSEIWFRWPVPAGIPGGLVVFSTLGSDFDTTLGAYIGTSSSNLAQVPTAINDDDTAGFLNSQVSFFAEPGSNYLIALDGFYGAQGNVVLSWTFSPGSAALPPAVPTPSAIVVSNGASVILDVPWSQEATCDWFQNGQPVASSGGVLLLDDVGDAAVGSYNAQLVNGNGVTDFSEPTLLQINTLQDGSTSSNSVAWVKFLKSANNAFKQPGGGGGRTIKLGGGGDTGGFGCTQVFNTANHADEPGEPLICNQNGTHPGWYSYVTPAAGSLLINTTGSSFNTLLGVFIGPGNSFSTLTNIGCGYTTNFALEGQPSVFIPNVPAGQTNYIVVEGENGASGVVHLNIFLGTTLLSIAPIKDGVTISWPAAGGTNLQVSVGLTDGWQPANRTITTAGNTNSVTATFGASSQYFRLVEPPSVFGQ